MERFDAPRHSAHGARVAAALAALALTVLGPLAAAAWAADGPVVPDGACAQEAAFKSKNSQHAANLHVFNNTNEVVQTLWLDFNGKRVFYKQVQPHTQYTQPTFLTHPWIVANLNGDCYRILEMTSLEQSVNVDPGPGGIVTTITDPTTSTSTSIASSDSSSSISSASIPAHVSSSSSSSSTNSSGVPILVVSVLSAAAVAGAIAFWRTHKPPLGPPSGLQHETLHTADDADLDEQIRQQREMQEDDDVDDDDPPYDDSTYQPPDGDEAPPVDLNDQGPASA